MILKIDFESEEALYIQLCNQIIMGIATEVLREGDSLPSVRQLADEIGINMHTVNKAYAVLKQEGFLRLDRRRGAVVALDMDKYEAFARGFVGTLKESMTETEKRTLALGALAMTVECGIRFLSDYLDGDKYFKIHYPEQNFVRARCHLALARDIRTRLEEMQKIVDKYCE